MATKAGQRFVKGAIVQTWFDTGAMGADILYGRVVKAGERTVTIEWESGLRNRITQDRQEVKPATHPELYRAPR